METSFLPAQSGGIDDTLPTCRETLCHNHGTCMPPPGGGTNRVCDCDLGYQGEFCDDTVNGALSLPLTISVLAVLIGLLVIAFIFAKLRQKQKKIHRKRMAEKHGYNIPV